MSLSDTYMIEKIPKTVARPFIKEHHYSGGCHNGPMTWGLFKDGELVGACAFATPCSENVRASIFGKEHKSWVTELHRLVVLRPHPTNLTSWFVARAVRGLLAYKPEVRAIISFADATEGHVGTIYQATNFGFYGSTGRKRFYRDGDGVLRHPRQCGVNIDREEAKRRGWTSEMRDAKYRYILLCPRNRSEKKTLPDLLLLDPLPYPEVNP